MLLRALLLAAALVALAGCGGSDKNAATTTGSGLPPGCTVPEVDRTMRTFLARPSFAPAGVFQVYATQESDGRKFLARNRDLAIAHARSRLELGERSRVIELRVAPQDFNHARVTFRLTRFGPDFRRRGITSRLVSGAGTIDCAHQKVAAWVTKGP